MRKPQMLGLCMALLLGASSVSVAGPPEGKGKIQRFDSVRKVVYIDGQRYQLRGQALELLSAYRAANGIGSLVGKELAFDPFGLGGGAYYIDQAEWPAAE